MEQEFQRGAGTQTIDRAAQLLTLVLEAERPRPLAELAGEAALPKSTASRLLGALERQGLIQQRGRRGSFEPGPVVRRFAYRGQLDGARIVGDHLHEPPQGEYLAPVLIEFRRLVVELCPRVLP